MVISSQERLVRLPKSITADDVMTLAGSCRRGARRIRRSMIGYDLSPDARAANERRIVTLTMWEPVLAQLARQMRAEDAAVGPAPAPFVSVGDAVQRVIAAGRCRE